MERRQFLSTLGIAGGAALAGCISGNDDIDDESGNDSDDDDANGGDEGTDNGDEQSSDGLGEPTEPVETFIDAARTGDIDAAVPIFHPSHPFHPDNVDEESDWEFNLSTGDAAIESVETEVMTEEVTVRDVFDNITAAELLFEEEFLADLLSDQRAALVETTILAENEEPAKLNSLVVAHEGEWRLLWQGEPVEAAESAPEFDTRVVEGIRFDTDEHQARVQFVNSPVADSVTVESTGPEDPDGIAITETSTDTPETTDYMNVSVDPTGDEVVVQATIDGESRLVHRERYPPSERIVEDITYNTDVEEDNPFGARARVTLNDVDSDGELTATSTRGGGESSIEPVGSATFVTVDINGDGEEVVVTLSEDGETEEIHRERFHG